MKFLAVVVFFVLFLVCQTIFTGILLQNRTNKNETKKRKNEKINKNSYRLNRRIIIIVITRSETICNGIWWCNGIGCIWILSLDFRITFCIACIIIECLCFIVGVVILIVCLGAYRFGGAFVKFGCPRVHV